MKMTPRDIVVGAEFAVRFERPYTVAGERKVHRWTMTATVTDVDSLTRVFTAELADLRDETDRPDFAKYPLEFTSLLDVVADRVAAGEWELMSLPTIPDHDDEGQQSIVLCPRDGRIHHATRTPKGERRCGGCGRKAV